MASVLFTISVLLYVPLVIYVPALAFSSGKNSWQYSATGNFGTLAKSEATEFLSKSTEQELKFCNKYQDLWHNIPQRTYFQSPQSLQNNLPA